MPSNGKSIVDFLCDMFPRHGLDDRQREVWGRGLAREDWETSTAIEAVKAMLKGRPTDFLPSYPSVESSVASHHRRLNAAQKPKTWQEEPTREESSQVERSRALIDGIFARATVIKNPKWGTREMLKLASWRRQNGVPPPIGPENRAARKRLSPELLEQERAVYREINREVRAR